MSTLLATAVASQGGTTKKQLSRESKATEIKEAFEAQVKSGVPFTYFIDQPLDGEGKAKIDKEGDEYLVLYIAQSRKLRDNATDDLNSLLLGWDNTRLVRTLHRVKSHIWENGIKNIFGVGVLQKDIQALGGKSTNIQIQHLNEPAYEGQSARQIVDTAQGKSFYLITKEGELTYEHSKLVVGEPQDLLIEAIRAEMEGFANPASQGEIL